MSFVIVQACAHRGGSEHLRSADIGPPTPLERIDPRSTTDPVAAAAAPSRDSGSSDEFATLIALHNACAEHFDLALSTSGDPITAGSVPTLLHLDPHASRSEWLPDGQWVHVFHDDRWLGAAWLVAEQGRMTIAEHCEVLDVDAELRGGEPLHFAVHWQLDPPAPLASTSGALLVDAHEGPESWLPALEDGIVLRLTNWCPEPLEYAFTERADEVPARRSILAAQSQRVVEVPPGWWLQHRAPERESPWHSAVSSEQASEMWLATNCIDQAVGVGAGIEAIELDEEGIDVDAD